MKLLDLVQRETIPDGWAEGDNIPWNDPEFSRRMLKEHLSQEHDLASRRSETIDRHVEWIHSVVLGGKPSKILDLGCGPGLYAMRLAKLGHACHGIDYAPAAVAFASQQAEISHLSCTFSQQDLRQADYGSGYDLVMQIYGEINVFSPQDARTILRKARSALVSGGILLLEASYFAQTQKIGQEPAGWFTSEGGLFSPKPHLGLEEHFWDIRMGTATTRFFIIDVESAEVTRYAQTMQAYYAEDYDRLLEECGFEVANVLPGLALGPDEPAHAEFCAIIARARE